MWWLSWHVLAGYARQHRLRTLVQVLAIAVGVALGYAVHLINASALNEFSSAVRAVTGQADASIAGAREGFDEQLFERVVASPAVELASPVLELDVPVLGIGSGRPPLLPIVGLDVFRATALSQTLLPVPSSEQGRRLAIIDDGVFLSPAALERFRVQVGGRLRVLAGAREVDLPVVGTLPGARAGQLVGVMDLGFAQWRLGQLGRLTRIDLKLAPGATIAALSRTLALPAGVAIAGADAETARVSNLSRAYRVNLNVLALVALFTGGFLVFSLQAQATIARRSQLAYLRVVGVTSNELQWLLVVEATLLGIVGSVVGLLLGAGIATLTLTLLGGDLGSGFFAGSRPEVQFSGVSVLLFFGLGLAAAIAGSWVPARDAATTSPALAMKAGAEEDALKPLGRIWPGLALLGVAGVLLALPPISGIPVWGYLSIAAVLIGSIALQPRLAHAAFGPLARRIEESSLGARSPTLLLAVTRIAQAPSFAAIGMAGIVASFALMIAMATMVSSFRGSVDDWLHRILPAELYARVAQTGSIAYFSEADLRRLAGHPGVARADFSRFAKLQLDPARAQVTLVVRPFDAADPGAELPLTGDAVRWTPEMPPPIWVTEAMVEIYGMSPGRVAELPLGGQLHRFTVAGVWRDYARQFGAIAMRTGDYQAATGDATITDAALWLKPGVMPTRVAEELRAQMDAGAATEFVQPGDIRKLSLQIFDRSFAVTYVLEIAAIVIGLTGIAATFSSQAIARTREFGMLRHIGFTRGQVLKLLAIEGALVTALAIAVGLATGLVVSVVLIKVINPQSFHWTMDFDAPQRLIGGLMVALMLAAVATAVIAGRRAVSIDAVRAVRDDW
ncbi:MAG: ABC transporter permease [Burkholderiaceae bacterium]|nr:ABC transporter permease [Burkholderiaceae bacterium]